MYKCWLFFLEYTKRKIIVDQSRLFQICTISTYLCTSSSHKQIITDILGKQVNAIASSNSIHSSQISAASSAETPFLSILFRTLPQCH